MKPRTGIILTLGVAGTFFGFRELLREESQVISENLNKEKDFTYENPYQVTGDQEPTLTQGVVNTPTEVDSSLVGNAGGKYDWGVGYTQEQKEKNRKDAEKIYGTLDDYTFKLYLPCTVGTGWILDYQIPQNKEEYPTKWYIATNMHVIWRLKFSNKNNTYGEKLMYSNTDYLRDRNKGPNPKNYKGKVRDKCEQIKETGQSGYFDMNFGNEKTWEKGRAHEFGAIAQNQINEPKLFFSAIDFLEGESKKKAGDYHFADFGVIEIEFTSPDAARDATNGFADKYKVGGNVEPIKFGRSLEKKYSTPKDLWEAKDNYYILAYPVLTKNGNQHWKQTRNFDEETTIASHLSGNNWDYATAYKEHSDYRGFVSAERTSPWGRVYSPSFKWNGEIYKEFGHNYQFDHLPMAEGSSGGIFVDSDGYAVGIINVTSANKYGTGGGKSWALPFRSEGTVTVEGKVTPGYDLILGGFVGQKRSYYSQVKEHILDKGGNTWLNASGRLDPKVSIPFKTKPS